MSLNEHDRSVFEAKFRLPLITKSIVVRRRLYALLDGAADCKLIIVTAPAGYGKTTLVGSWLQARCDVDHTTDSRVERRVCAWLALDERDNDVVIFVDHLVAAMQCASSDIRFDVTGLIQLPAQPSVHELARFLIASLGDLAVTLTLTLDDYHVIHESKIHALLEILLAYSPDRLKLIVITRHDTPLPVARLALQGKAQQLRASDMRFRPEETAEFLDVALPVKPPLEILAAVTEQADGWIAQLQLAAVLIRQAPERVLPDAIRNRAIDYLMEELLANEEPAVRAFLLATSVLDRFSAALADALLCADCDNERESDLLKGWSSHEAHQIFKRVAQSGLFVAGVDVTYGWCRYHELFRDLLCQRLQWEYPAALPTLRRRAFEWFKQAGHVEEALDQAQALGDTEAMADVVELHALEAIAHYRWQTAQYWIETLTPDAVRKRPALLLAEGYFLCNAGAVERLGKVLEWAGNALSSPHRVDGARSPLWQGTLELLTAQHAYMTNQLDESRAAAERALEILPRECLFERSAAVLSLSASKFHHGRFDEGRALLQAQLRDEVDERSPTAARLRTSLAISYSSEGNFRRAKRELEMVEHIFGPGQPYNESWRHFVLGRIAYEWNELDCAADHFGIAARAHGGNYLRALEALLGLALVAEARRDAKAVGDYAEQALLLAKATGSENLITLALSFRTRLHLMRGQPAPDLVSLPSAVHEDALLLWTPIELPRVTEAWRLARTGRIQDTKAAQLMLEEAVEFMAAQHLYVSLVPALGLLALIYGLGDQKSRALTTLGLAVEIAARGGLLRSLLDFGPEMTGLLYQLKLPAAVGEHVTALLACAAATSQPPTIAKRQEMFIEPLTPRELTVLELMAANLSDKEIAAALCISPLTVRKHTSNVIQKLGVSNRRQAAARAIQLRLVTGAVEARG